MKQKLLETPGTRSLDTLQFREDLERRGGARVEDLCRVIVTPRDCSRAGINRASKTER